MPGIATCRECHRAGGGAQTGCSECHLYHDPTKERPPDGLLTLPQLSGRTAATAAPPAKPARK